MKQNSKIATALLTNLAPKVFSLMAAVFIVLTIHFVNVNDRTVTLPLEVTLPEGFRAVSLVPSTVDVTITGEDKVIYLVDPAQIKAYADFSGVTASGITRTPVHLVYQENIFQADGLTVTPTPSSVRILFEAY